MMYKCRGCGLYYFDGETNVNSSTVVHGICDDCRELFYNKKRVINKQFTTNNTIVMEEVK